MQQTRWLDLGYEIDWYVRKIWLWLSGFSIWRRYSMITLMAFYFGVLNMLWRIQDSNPNVFMFWNLWSFSYFCFGMVFLCWDLFSLDLDSCDSYFTIGTSESWSASSHLPINVLVIHVLFASYWNMHLYCNWTTIWGSWKANHICTVRPWIGWATQYGWIWFVLLGGSSKLAMYLLKEQVKLWGWFGFITRFGLLKYLYYWLWSTYITLPSLIFSLCILGVGTLISETKRLKNKDEGWRWVSKVGMWKKKEGEGQMFFRTRVEIRERHILILSCS